MVNSVNVRKLNSGVIIILYQVNGLADKNDIAAKFMQLLLNFQNISPNRVLPIAICVMLN